MSPADLALIKQAFTTPGNPEMKAFVMGRIAVDAERATVRVVVEMGEAASGNEKPGTKTGSFNRTLHLVRDSALWKVCKYGSSEEELATEISRAPTIEARKALLAANQDLATIELNRALLTEATSLYRKSSYAIALELYGLALEIAQRLGDKLGIARGFSGLGVVNSSQGNYASALDYYQKSQEIAEQIGDKRTISNALHNIAIVRAGQGDFNEALDYYNKSLRLREDLGDKALIAQSLNTIANVYAEQGLLKEALEHYQRSLKIAEEAGDKSQIATTLSNTGNIHYWYADFMRAARYFETSLKLCQEIGDKAQAARALGNLANVHLMQGTYDQSLPYYLRSLKIFEELGDKLDIANALDNIGILWVARGDYPQAVKYYQDALKIAEELADKPDIAYIVRNLGSVYKDQGQYGRALDYYERALKLYGEIGGGPPIGELLNDFAELYYLQGNYSRALEYANRAISIAKEVNSPGALWVASTNAGKAYWQLNRLDQARQAFLDAIAAIEELRNQVAGGTQEQQQFLEHGIAPYHAIADLLASENRAAEALAFAERAKSRALLDLLQSGKGDIAKAMTGLERDQEQQLNSRLVLLNTQFLKEKAQDAPNRSRLADLNDQLAKTRLEFEAFRTNLYIAHPELEVQRGHYQPMTLRECANLIPDSNSALLEFLVSEDKTLLFVLTKNMTGVDEDGIGLQVYQIPIKQKDLLELSDRFRQSLAARDLRYRDQAVRLYDLLLKPAAAVLRLKTNLIIVPDGPLWELPFQALQPARNRCLVEDAAISYAPSLGALREMSKARIAGHAPGGRPKPETTLLALGNPTVGKEASSGIKEVFMDADLVPLPEAERQVKALEQIYGRPESKIYVGSDATEDRFKAEASSCRILHLATHGIVNNASPMYSQIVLGRSEGSSNDGLLEAWEIMNLDLQADLAVLSACDTARGRVRAGEGMIGLSWALFVAGCPAIVVSQWKIDSESSTGLMLDFHRNLKAGLAKSEALRRAELTLLKSKRYHHPVYWAPFILVGSDS
jgi:CHAT domain-containing protein/tetratricopeptide (TPR) repeat protein